MKPNLLLVDDEERILRSLSMLFRAGYNVTATVDAYAALEQVRGQAFHVVVSDQRMPAMRGAELLRRVRELSPNTMRVLLTGYSELDAIVASVNDGEVFRFVSKPWNAIDLKQTVAQAAGIAQELFVRAQRPAAETVAGAAEVLVLDDDESVVADVRAAIGEGVVVHAARSLEEAFAVLERRPVGVLISELQLRNESATMALKLLKAQHPEVVTIVLTPFQDTNVLIGLINEGQVYRFLPKPVRRGPLGMNVASALRQHRALRAAPALRRAHAVARAAAASDDAGLADRVMGYLARLRRRNEPNVEVP